MPPPGRTAPAPTAASVQAACCTTFDALRAMSAKLRPVPGSFGPSTLSAITPYICGECAFADMRTAIMTTTAALGGFVYVLGWDGDGGTPMGGGQTLLDVLKDAATRRVPVFALYNQPPNVSTTNLQNLSSGLPPPVDVPIVKDIRGLPSAWAVTDNRIPQIDLQGFLVTLGLATPPPAPRAHNRGGPGAHHQKLVVVNTPLGLVAFVGGLDIVKDRVPIAGAPPPMHDVHVQIWGPGAQLLLDEFVKRWKDNPLAASKLPAVERGNAVSSFVAQTKPFFFDSTVSVGTTYVDRGSTGLPPSSTLPSGGSHSAFTLFADLVNGARKFIYIEDQYLFGPHVAAMLAQKLRSDSHVQIMMLTNWLLGAIDDEIPGCEFARAEFVRTLQAADPTGSRFGIFALKAPADQTKANAFGIYVHAKMSIADDATAVVGSANCNERGFGYDSEVVASMTTPRPTGQSFPQRLRLMLWQKHTGQTAAQLLAAAPSIATYTKPSPASMIEKYDVVKDAQAIWQKRKDFFEGRLTINDQETALKYGALLLVLNHNGVDYKTVDPALAFPASLRTAFFDYSDPGG